MCVLAHRLEGMLSSNAAAFVAAEGDFRLIAVRVDGVSPLSAAHGSLEAGADGIAPHGRGTFGVLLANRFHDHAAQLIRAGKNH